MYKTKYPKEYLLKNSNVFYSEACLNPVLLNA